jgi:ABC-2 type transport system permease protein
VHEVSAVLAIAHRDLVKLLRDRTRLVSDFAFPLIFIGILGTTLQAGFGTPGGFNLLTFLFTGVFAQTVWQSAALGVISLIADREQDFSQEMFVSPISRFSIIFGKILGESLVALPQALAILFFGFVIGVPLSLPVLVALVPVAFLMAIFGGAFGVLILSNLKSQQAASQIFPFVMLPQFFLAGVFTPIDHLPWFLDILSRLAPMRYAIDLVRDVYYAGHPEPVRVALLDAPTNLAIIAAMFGLFMLAGTTLFVRSERNR